MIVAIEGEPVTKFDDVLSYLQRNTSPGDTVSLSIWRNGQTEEVELTLAPQWKTPHRRDLRLQISDGRVLWNETSPVQAPYAGRETCLGAIGGRQRLFYARLPAPFSA